MIRLTAIRDALERLDPVRLRPWPETAAGASVALVLAGPEDDPRLCFIQRATRAGDPWSGQMAFPGGRAEEWDPTPRAVAERETREEVGLVLDNAEYLGRLSELRISHSGVVTKDVLSPFVYYIGVELPRFGTSEEVENAYWIPLRELWDERHATTFEYERQGAPVRLPGIRHGDRIIWGLTYMMLESFAEALGARLPGAR